MYFRVNFLMQSLYKNHACTMHRIFSISFPVSLYLWTLSTGFSTVTGIQDFYRTLKTNIKTSFFLQGHYFYGNIFYIDIPNEDARCTFLIKYNLNLIKGL